MKLQPKSTNEESILKLTKPTAKAVVRAINTHVKALTRGSTLIDRDSGTERSKKVNGADNTFGFFQRNELKLGKALGSGGFSEVYEIAAFQPREAADVPQLYQKDEVKARTFYQANATNNNGPKYAIKHLKRSTLKNTKEFAMAAADLEVEARFLSNLDHENILKIRGRSATGIESYLNGEHDGYFLILDRLHETLDQRIYKWSEERHTRSWELFGSPHKSQMIENTTSRLYTCTRIAHQIASAMAYLHSKNIVFRDLKPDNVGFDEQGKVKIFDFGLSRELPEMCTNVNDVYEMSGKMGTIRYMAPEVALAKPYNQKVDCYSWAMLFWSCLSMEKPYYDLSRAGHLTLVCKRGERPQTTGLPEDIERVLVKAWDQRIRSRFTMSEVCGYLRRIEKRLLDDLGQKTVKVQKKSVASRLIPSFVRRKAKKQTAASKTVVSMAA